MSETPTTKTGYKTIGFWLTAITTAGAAVAASGAGLGAVESMVALIISGLSAAGYAAFRAFKKSDDATKPAWKTTEFWLSIATAVISLVYASGVVSDGGTLDKVIGFGVALLAMAGYQVSKPKK